MNDTNKLTNFQKISLLKNAFPVGTKVKLYHMEGENLPYGITGKVIKVDDIGQIHVQWENGSSLAINTELDVFSVVK